MNTITIQLCTEDRARLDNILAALQNLGGAPILSQEQPKTAEPIKTAPAAEKPQDEAPAKPAAPSVTLEAIQQKVVQLAAKGADEKTKARAIINQYAPKVSAIPENKLAEVWEQLTALEKEG